MKFSSDRSVWAPQYLSDFTCTGPKASVSVLVPAIVYAVAWKLLLEKRGCREAFERLVAVLAVGEFRQRAELEAALVDNVALEVTELKTLSEAVDGLGRAVQVQAEAADIDIPPAPAPAFAAQAEPRSMIAAQRRIDWPRR